MNKYGKQIGESVSAKKNTRNENNGLRSRAPPGAEPGSFHVAREHEVVHQRYLENILEPEVPFVTPGPAKWLYATCLKAVVRVPASTFSHGSVKVTTQLDQMLEMSQDVATASNWGSETEQTTTFPPSIPFFLSQPLKNPNGSVSESLKFDAPAYSFPSSPGGSYYPGDWVILSGPLVFTLSTQMTGTYTFTVGRYDPDSDVHTIVAFISVNIVNPGTTIVSLPIAANTSLTNLAISLARTGAAGMTSVSLTLQQSNNIQRISGSFTSVSSFENLFSSNASAVDLIEKSKGFKVSAMSVRLQNSTAQLNRGGTLNMAQLPPGSAPSIPQRADVLFDMLGTLPTVMTKCAQPLAKGGHISYVPQDFSQLTFSRYPGQPGSCLLFAWQNTPSQLGGYYQQDLTVEIKMNVEISTTDPSLRYTLRSPLAFDYVEWFLSYEGVTENCCGCNPDHMERIRKIVKGFLNHPATRALGSALVRAAPAALALL